MKKRQPPPKMLMMMRQVQDMQLLQKEVIELQTKRREVMGDRKYRIEGILSWIPYTLYILYMFWLMVTRSSGKLWGIVEM